MVNQSLHWTLINPGNLKNESIQFQYLSQGVTRVRFSGRYKIEIESTHYRRDRDRDRDYNLL